MINATYYAIQTANSTYLAERIGDSDTFSVLGPVDSFRLNGLPTAGNSFTYDGYASRKRTSPVRRITPLTREQYEAA